MTDTAGYLRPAFGPAGTGVDGTGVDGTGVDGTDGFQAVRAALLACAAEHRSGVLRITGQPGGLIELADGGIASIETAGAPGPDLVLIRSGRITESGWAAAFTAAAEHGQLAAELIRRGLIGAGELEAVITIALADAMFAVASGSVDACEPVAGTDRLMLRLAPPAAAGSLLAETKRRLEVLAAAPGLVRHDRDRVTSAAQPGPMTGLGLAPGLGPGLGTAGQQLLALANGRRTARDLAFITGRGVYAISLELSRLHGAGLVAITSRRAIPPASSLATRTELTQAPADERAGEPGVPPPALPQRHQPGRQARPGPAELMAPASSTLHRLFRLFPAGHDSADPAEPEADT